MLRRKLPITRAAALVRRFSASPAQDLSPATTAVRKGHELDLSKVMPLLHEAGAVDAASSVEVSQFSHGQSNPTYLLSVDGTKKLVLRKLVGSWASV